MTCKRTIDEEIERIYRSRCREWRLPIQGIVQMFQAGRNAAKQDRDIEDAVLATASLYQRAA